MYYTFQNDYSKALFKNNVDIDGIRIIVKYKDEVTDNVTLESTLSEFDNIPEHDVIFEILSENDMMYCYQFINKDKFTNWGNYVHGIDLACSFINAECGMIW